MNLPASNVGSHGLIEALIECKKEMESELARIDGVEKKVEWVQRELIRIKCYLKDADSKHKGDERVQTWLNELCNVAYRIEDATDTFSLEFQNIRQEDDPKYPTFIPSIKKLCTRPLDVQKLDTELDDIQKELEGISKSMFDYIKVLQNASKGEAVKLPLAHMPLRRATYQELDETEVVGMQADKNNIMKLLRPEETLRRAVITIVGTGGLGKTTLAHMVYRSAKADFKRHMMLSISPQFRLIDLLREMRSSISQQSSLIDLLREMQSSISQLSSFTNIFKEMCSSIFEQFSVAGFFRIILGQLVKDSVTENQCMRNLINELRSLLSSRRYLIILDDVWRVDLWNQLKDALPDVNNGSRILMTSRFMVVAKSADPYMEPYELRLLDDRESLDLLLKKALHGQNLENDFPSDLRMVADKLSKRCKGLPIALMVVGRILSTKQQFYPAWEPVLQTMDWHSDGKDCMEVLAMSYEDMPDYLKPCFLYLASFPEGHTISAKCLIRMWVAEGFLPRDERKSMEKIAEDRLEELCQRSMVRVSSRCMNGSIKCFQVHDLLRDLAMHEAGQENFVTVFSQASSVKKPNRATRRASLQYSHQAQQRDPRFMNYVGPNTRSLLWFGQGLCKFSFNFRLLKVLELVGVKNDSRYEVKGFEELIHLKYCGFRNCRIDISSCSFYHMKTLETLDVRGTGAELSNTLWTIGTLRHVLCVSMSNGPISTANLENLRTMRWVSVPESWARGVPLLNNLRKLGVSNYPFDDWIRVINLLETLPFLVSLGIDGESLPMEIVYPIALPNYHNLQSLYLKGKWSEIVTLQASLFPPYLIKLTLINSQLRQNPMPELGKLKTLKKLCLKGNVSNYSGPTNCPKGFPVLQYLEVDEHSNLEVLTVAQGVMPKLTYLKAYIEFHLPPELQRVTIDSVRNIDLNI